MAGSLNCLCAGAVPIALLGGDGSADSLRAADPTPCSTASPTCQQFDRLFTARPLESAAD